MAMTDFTPGPWFNDDGLVYGRAGYGPVSFDIFDVEQWQGDTVEGHANARLIAKAPAMYAALKALVIKNDRVLAALAEVEGK